MTNTKQGKYQYIDATGGIVALVSGEVKIGDKVVVSEIERTVLSVRDTGSVTDCGPDYEAVPVSLCVVTGIPTKQEKLLCGPTAYEAYLDRVYDSGYSPSDDYDD